jgi:hypothetical protein
MLNFVGLELIYTDSHGDLINLIRWANCLNGHLTRK